MCVKIHWNRRIDDDFTNRATNGSKRRLDKKGVQNESALNVTIRKYDKAHASRLQLILKKAVFSLFPIKCLTIFLPLFLLKVLV